MEKSNKAFWPMVVLLCVILAGVCYSYENRLAAYDRHVTKLQEELNDSAVKLANNAVSIADLKAGLVRLEEARLKDIAKQKALVKKNVVSTDKKATPKEVCKTSSPKIIQTGKRIQTKKTTSSTQPVMIVHTPLKERLISYLF